MFRKANVFALTQFRVNLTKQQHGVWKSQGRAQYIQQQYEKYYRHYSREEDKDHLDSKIPKWPRQCKLIQIRQRKLWSNDNWLKLK